MVARYTEAGQQALDEAVRQTVIEHGVRAAWKELERQFQEGGSGGVYVIADDQLIDGTVDMRKVIDAVFRATLTGF